MITLNTALKEVDVLLSPSKDQRFVATEKIFSQRDYPGFIALSCANIAVIAFVLWYWFSPQHPVGSPLVFLGLTSLLLIKLGINQARWYMLPSMERPLSIPSRPGWKVAVVTTIVPSGESLDMFELTVKALVALDYPHDTWVLDEGDDDQVKSLCRRLGAKHFTRKGIHRYQTAVGQYQSNTKHGNYNSWFAETGLDSYDIIAAFDADHVPESSFLSQVLGFFDDARVGYVQLPQVYYNKDASFIARGAAEETYAYFACTQPAAFALGHPLIVGGHSTHRAVALKQIGGFGAHAADDLLTTLIYRARGWRGVYVPRVLARGLTPVDWNTYLRQQLRWAKSVLDIKFNHLPRLATNLPRKERWMRYLHGLNFVEGGITSFLFLLLVAVMLLTGQVPQLVSFTTLAVLVPLAGVWLLCEYFRQRFYLEPESEQGVPWRALLLRYAKWPFLFWAFCSVIRGEPVIYTLTPKAPIHSKKLLLFWPHGVVVVVISLCWAIGTATGANKIPVLHFLAGLIVFGSLALIMTEFRRSSTRLISPRHQTGGYHGS